MKQVNDSKRKKQFSMGLLLATYVGVLVYLSGYIA